MTLMIWTLSERRPKETTFYTGANGAIIVCNLEKWSTISKMIKWADSINSNIGNIPLFFIGNNYDLAEPDHITLLKKIAKSYESPWYYINYEDKDEVKEVFNSVARKLLELKEIDPDA